MLHNQFTVKNNKCCWNFINAIKQFNKIRWSINDSMQKLILIQRLSALNLQLLHLISAVYKHFRSPIKYSLGQETAKRDLNVWVKLPQIHRPTSHLEASHCPFIRPRPGLGYTERKIRKPAHFWFNLNRNISTPGVPTYHRTSCQLQCNDPIKGASKLNSIQYQYLWCFFTFAVSETFSFKYVKILKSLFWSCQKFIYPSGWNNFESVRLVLPRLPLQKKLQNLLHIPSSKQMQWCLRHVVKTKSK